VLPAGHRPDADMVVLVKSRTSALADFVLGSTVRRLLGTAECDVAIAPAGLGNDAGCTASGARAARRLAAGRSARLTAPLRKQCVPGSVLMHDTVDS
jgi:hypothetical protein